MPDPYQRWSLHVTEQVLEQGTAYQAAIYKDHSMLAFGIGDDQEEAVLSAALHLAGKERPTVRQRVQLEAAVHIAFGDQEDQDDEFDHPLKMKDDSEFEGMLNLVRQL